MGNEGRLQGNEQIHSICSVPPTAPRAPHHHSPSLTTQSINGAGLLLIPAKCYMDTQACKLYNETHTHTQTSLQPHTRRLLAALANQWFMADSHRIASASSMQLVLG